MGETSKKISVLHLTQNIQNRKELAVLHLTQTIHKLEI